MIKDRFNSTRIVFKGTDGTVVNRFDYAPYGEVIRSLESGDLVSFTYTGQEMDKHLGVMTDQARLQVGAKRRSGARRNPLREFHTPYNYVGNNPFSFTDPSGMVGESVNPAFSQDQLSAFYYEFDQNCEGYWAPS
ncbi:MAG: hypothetical protein HUU10_13510, partial [Bacteroidetes bacterium]|nr:hypothetical protein [Bacteroidota bacterium]